MNWKKILRITLFAALGLLLLYFSFRGVKWEDFVDQLKQTNFYWVGASMIVGAISFYIRAARWRIILMGVGAPVKRLDTFDGVSMAYLTNFALPRAGEVARCGVISARSALSFDAVIGTVVFERTFDVLCLLVITILTAILRWDVFGTFLQEQIWQRVIAMLGGSTLLAIGLCVGIPALIALLIYLNYNKLRQRPVFQKVARFFVGIWKGLVNSFKMPHKGYFFLLTLLMWTFFVGTSYTTILATPLASQFDVVDALFLMVVGSFGWVVPVQGGFGAFHYILSLALLLVYNIDETRGIAFATLSHESQALTMLLCGIFAVIHIGVTRKRSPLTSGTDAA